MADANATEEPYKAEELVADATEIGRWNSGISEHMELANLTAKAPKFFGII